MRIFYNLSLLIALFSMASHAAPKKEVYIPMDFSTCGYHASEQAIPDVPAVYIITPQHPEHIQQAIDKLASQKTNKQGFRGAILLQAGEYRITEPLRISASGIVIRGAGKSATKIIKEGVERGAAIYIEGKCSEISNEETFVSDTKVKAGSTTFNLESAANITVGSRIAITRPCTKEWIASLKMNDFGGGLDYTGWKQGDIDITWHRTVTAISGNQITIDSPITTTLDSQWGKTSVRTIISTSAKNASQPSYKEISECGIEDLSIISALDAGGNNLTGEDHCWEGIWIDNAIDCWIRSVDFSGLAGSAVDLQKNTQRITVEDCIADNPLSEIGGWRRCVFTTRGEQNLFQRCISRHGIHDFSTGYCAAGPNAFVQCEGEESLSFSGSIGSWAGGVLFDIVNIEGNDLAFKNLEQFRTGTGFNAANSMFWQCTASTIWCYSPDEDNKNSGNGCWATLTGNGEWTSSNDHVYPRSLFYAQLEKRCPNTTVKAHILPRNTNASSSPTVEQAADLAKESFTTPRLTMEMWLDSVSLSRNATATNEPNRKIPTFGEKDKAKKSKDGQKAISESELMEFLKPLGKEYHITWWNGRTKDNARFKPTTKFSPTRFVPGREGYGWTDNLDSLVNFLAENDYQAIYHHYGLWYDIRRTDHERVKRADGSVEAPFYEQPFARSGQGKAWDGLTRYDLTKPNLWYWNRLQEFAEKALPKHIFLYNCHYFQHNILEAGAHWVDCPWRPVNNVNYEAEESGLPEPVPFTGDKRIFIADQFYNISNPVMAKYHRNYIRMCLEQSASYPNIIQFISEEFTGPEHFVRFWLKTIKEWEQETGKNAIVALSCTKDVQDAILNDAELSKVVDIIDIRYWHYNQTECWAPKGGQNLAPRQHMRKWQKGKVGKEQVQQAISEYQQRYPDKIVIYNAEGK